MKVYTISEQLKMTCSKLLCQQTNPQWHSFIQKTYIMSASDVGWRCHNCGTYYRQMSYADYKELLKKKDRS
jgi:hypothetical protein